MMFEFAIDVKELTKSFNGKIAVDHLSLQVKKGEIFGFLGPNGSGKTTTIRMLCGLMLPDSGQGTCLGYDIFKSAAQVKSLIGYVPQSFSLYKDLTVYENLLFIARVYGHHDYEERAQRQMQDLGLLKYKNILTGRLSGGWKQRLSLAVALIHDPQLLLLDEPTAGVDPKARREFWNDISELTLKGITSLVSTHYMDEAERCHRLAYIVNGKLMIEGTIPDIIHNVALTAYSGTGEQLVKTVEALRQKAGVEQATVLGNQIRICGKDREFLHQLIKSYPEIEWKQVEASLEEVFIHLVKERTNDVV
jgi:ABC-2 type transport system ATP-binding protein